MTMNGRSRRPDPPRNAIACCIPLTIGSSGRYVETFKIHCGKRFGAKKTPLTKLRITTVNGPTEPAISEVVINRVNASPIAENVKTPSTV